MKRNAKHEPPPLKKLAAWCGITTSWVALVTALAHATATGRGPHYVGFALAVLVIVPFMVVGALLIQSRSRQTIAATLLTMVGTTAFADAVSMLGGAPSVRPVAVLFGVGIAFGCIVGVLAALHQLGEQAHGSLRFLIVEVAAIALVVWTGSIAPALLAGVVYWVLWKSAPAPPQPLRVYRGGDGTRS